MAATKVWKGTLNFGLLSIPVYLNVAAREKKVETHLYHTRCHQPIKKPNWCQQCDSRLGEAESYRGVPAGGRIVQLSDEEIEAIVPQTEKVMEINLCVKQKDVDPIYFSESFYMLPDVGGTKAYSLLSRVLKETGHVAIAQLSKSKREHVVLIRPKDNGLMIHFAWYPDEIAEVPEFSNFQPADVTANEIKLAKTLMDSMVGEFQPEQYEDGYRQRLNTLIASKLDRSVTAPAPVRGTQVRPTVDIAAALEASLVNRPKRRVRVPDEPASKPRKSRAA